MRTSLWAGIVGLAWFGCGSGLGDVVVQEVSSTNPSMPDITVSRVQNCFATYGGQLPPGRHHFNPVVKVDQDGMRWGVETPDMPSSAPDLAACTRIVLRDMAIPSSVFNMHSTQSTVSTSEVTPAQRLYLGNPAVVVVVAVGLSEIMLEAGAYTILFAVTVHVVDKAAKDVAELAKPGFKKCVSHYTACMATGLSNPFRGNHWTASHCNGCFERCQTDGRWPDAVGGETCMYW